METSTSPAAVARDTSTHDSNKPPNELLSWDDNEFDDVDFHLPEIKSVRSAVPLAENEIDDAAAGSDADWHQPTRISAPKQSPENSSFVALKEASFDGHELYLTKQFKSLNTPTSRTKPLCARCTRPLDEERSNFRLCNKCHVYPRAKVSIDIAPPSRNATILHDKDSAEGHSNALPHDSSGVLNASRASNIVVSSALGNSPESERDLYLNNQFKSLNTPASRKKPRCAHCTRPLNGELSSTSRLCDRCSE